MVASRFLFRNSRIGLKAKCILGLGALLLGGVTYYQSMHLALNGLLATTTERLKRDCAALEDAVAGFRSDLLVVADTPPVQGILRAKDHGGVDPMTGDRTEYWFTRLEQIFTAFLANHPEYCQLRYLDERGSELVRVQSGQKIITVTPRAGLQNKSQYPYFTETIRLPPGGEIYY